MVRDLLWNASERRPRALWRLLLQTLLMAVLGVAPILLLAEPLTALHKRGLFLAELEKKSYDIVINLMIGPLLTVMILLSVAWAARWVDRRRLSDLGLQLGRRWAREFGFGVVLGAALAGGVFLWEYCTGWIQVVGVLQATAGCSVTLALFFSLVKVVCVGIYEETVCRGYHLKNPAEGLHGPLSSVAAVAAGAFLTSAIFGAGHAFNDNATLVSSLNLALNGLLFAAAYVTTGRLGMPIGLHMSWNLFQGAVFGFPVSGDKEIASILAIRQGGSGWLTGGDFGPEAGLTGTAATLVGIALICLARRRLGGRRPLIRREIADYASADPAQRRSASDSRG